MGALITRDRQATESVLTPLEVSWLLRCSPATVYRLIREQGLPAFRIGRKYRISLPLLRRWIEAQSRPEQDEWSRRLEVVSEAMRREFLLRSSTDGEYSRRIASAVARVRASAG